MGLKMTSESVDNKEQGAWDPVPWDTNISGWTREEEPAKKMERQQPGKYKKIRRVWCPENKQKKVGRSM